MIAKSILMFGQPCILACDAKCHKAWGMNGGRPKVYLEESPEVIRGQGFGATGWPEFDPPDDFGWDNYAYLADDEVGDAPIDPGSYEGDHGKPQTPNERLNKWCARECERSRVVDDVHGKIVDFELPDFSQRVYNIYPQSRPTPTE